MRCLYSVRCVCSSCSLRRPAGRLCTHTDASSARRPGHFPVAITGAAPAALSSPPPAPSSSSLILINSTPAADMPRGCRSRFWGAAGRVPRPHPSCPLIVHMLRRGRAPRPASDRKRQAPRAGIGSSCTSQRPTRRTATPRAVSAVFSLSCHCPIL